MLYGIIICLILLLYIFVLLRPGKAAVYPDAVLVDYAHRGAHGDGIPENSMAAFARAADNGCGIELDVQLSKDGQVMVFHDTYLERMTGMPGKCGDYTAEELSAIRLAGTEETIPTFRDVLALVHGRVPLLVELKGESLDTAVCAPTAALLRGYSGKFIVESFNPCLLGWFARHEPKMIRGLLYTNVTKQNGLSPISLMPVTVGSTSVRHHGCSCICTARPSGYGRFPPMPSSSNGAKRGCARSMRASCRAHAPDRRQGMAS